MTAVYRTRPQHASAVTGDRKRRLIYSLTDLSAPRPVPRTVAWSRDRLTASLDRADLTATWSKQ